MYWTVLGPTLQRQHLASAPEYTLQRHLCEHIHCEHGAFNLPLQQYVYMSRHSPLLRNTPTTDTWNSQCNPDPQRRRRQPSILEILPIPSPSSRHTCWLHELCRRKRISYIILTEGFRDRFARVSHLVKTNGWGLLTMWIVGRQSRRTQM